MKNVVPTDSKAENRGDGGIDPKWINIVPLFPDRIETTAADTDRLFRQCGIIEAALMLPIYPEGENPAAKIEFFAACFRRWKSQITEPAVRPGILLQSTLGHIERGQRPTPATWQQAINIHGVERMRMCPLDPGFRAYLASAVTMLAGEKPAFLMVDDDFRMLDGQGMECFCPQHVARFQKVTGSDDDGETLRRKILADGADGQLLREYESMCLAVLEECAAEIRRAIDQADHAIPCYCCGPWNDFPLYRAISQILAGGHPSVLRLANTTYMESAPKEYYPQVLFSTVFQQHVASSVDQLLIEADTWPQHRFSKSAANLHTQLAGCFLHGLAGAKLWLTNYSYPDNSEGVFYEEVLTKNRNFYRQLLAIGRELHFDGVQTVLPEDVLTQWSALEPRRMVNLPQLQRDFFDRAGIPGYFAGMASENRAGLRLITGEMATYLSEPELRECFRHGLLLGGRAAEILTRRGYANRMGVMAEAKKFFFTEERYGDGEIIAHSNGNFNTRHLTICMPGVEVVSELIERDFYHAIDYRVIAPATTFFVNPEGGRIGVIAESDIVVSPWRKQRWIALLEKIADQKLPVTAVDHADLFIRYGHTQYGEKILFAVNLSYDALPELHLRFAETPERVERLDEDGVWRQVPSKSGTIVWPLGTLECALLRLLASKDF